MKKITVTNKVTLFIDGQEVAVDSLTSDFFVNYFKKRSGTKSPIIEIKANKELGLRTRYAPTLSYVYSDRSVPVEYNIGWNASKWCTLNIETQIENSEYYVGIIKADVTSVMNAAE